MANILSIRTLFLVVFFFCLKETYSGRIKRIVRGTPVTCGEQPRVASLRNSTSDQHICGATIISPDHALTAAHCVQHPAHQYYLQLNNYCAEDGSYPMAEVLDVIPHEEYDKFTRAHDLAVLLITLDLDDEAFSGSVLPTSSFGLTSECKIYGYGTTDPSAPTAFTDTLLVGKVETVSLDDCIRQLGPFVAPDYDHGMMCALGEGADACQGDSGGPLICANSLLQGLSSYGLSCGVQGQPGVYTSIGAHLSWINDVINRRSHE